jgi:hypothetical protein
VTDNVELEFEFSVEIQTVCANMHLQLALVLIYVLEIGESSVNVFFIRPIQLVASMFLNVNIDTIKLIRQDREPKITTRTDQHTVSAWQTRKIDVPK